MSQRARLKKNRDSVRGYAIKKRDVKSSTNNSSSRQNTNNKQKTANKQNTTRRKVRRKRK